MPGCAEQYPRIETRMRERRACSTSSSLASRFPPRYSSSVRGDALPRPLLFGSTQWHYIEERTPGILCPFCVHCFGTGDAKAACCPLLVPKCSKAAKTDGRGGVQGTDTAAESGA
eukprot:Hpha_TRINITY_DN16001_c3_g1::TRINITY_DN16001_c3_g1_i10::g.121431::m.121431